MSISVNIIAQSGQVSIPASMRDVVGIGPHEQVEHPGDGERVHIAVVPTDPLALGTREEFWESVARADADYAAGRVSEVHSMADNMRARYGL